MIAHEFLMLAVRDGLREGTITPEDLQTAVREYRTEAAAPQETAPVSDSVLLPVAATAGPVSKKLTLIDVLFYLAGGIFYAALSVMANQAGANAPLVRIAVMLLGGLSLWTVAFLLG